MSDAKRIHTLTINGHESDTELCRLGEKTDKSPYCVWAHFHRHCYTPIYSLLFGSERSGRTKVFCEIGVAGGDSIAMWRNYFSPETTIIAMDNCVGFLDLLVKRELPNVFAFHTDVTDKNYLEQQVTLAVESYKLYDIVLDDSDHNMESQRNILEAFLPHMSPGGKIIIEDVDRIRTAADYETLLGADLLAKFESIFYINVEHKNRFSGDHNNDALLVFNCK